MDLGKIIADRRHQLNILQTDLAQLADVGISTVKDIERGKGNPSVNTLLRICNVLGLQLKLELKKIEL